MCILISMALMKEIEKVTNKWKDIQCSWIGRISIVNTSILPQVMCRFSAISIKILMVFLTEIKNILKFMWNQKSKRILRMEQPWSQHTF